MCSVGVWVLVFHHQGCLAQKFEVFNEKGSKRKAPFLDAEDEELDEPEDGPRAVSKVPNEDVSKESSV